VPCPLAIGYSRMATLGVALRAICLKFWHYYPTDAVSMASI
jgi:hypothetical protein